MRDRVQSYMCLHFASIKSTDGNETRLFLKSFLIATSWFLIPAEAIRIDHIAACSTALRSATEKNDMGGFVTLQCPSKMIQRSSTAD